MRKEDQEMKHKQRGSAHLMFTVVMFGSFTIFAIGACTAILFSTLTMQSVQEKSTKCIQQQGEVVLVLNSKQQVKLVRCKKDGALYDDF